MKHLGTWEKNYAKTMKDFRMYKGQGLQKTRKTSYLGFSQNADDGRILFVDESIIKCSGVSLVTSLPEIGIDISAVRRDT